MKSKTLLILVILTAALVGLAYLVQRRPVSPAQTIDTGSLLFEGLAAKLNNAVSLTVQRGKEQTELVRKGDSWVLADKGDYPAEFERVKEALISLADLKLVERKTANKELYDKLGLADPRAEGATSRLITVKDASGGVIAAVVVGNMSAARQGATPAYFVRKPDDAQTWLAEGRLTAEPDALSWVKRDMISIDKDRLKSVEVSRGADAAAGRLRVFRDSRSDSQFLIQDKPPERDVKGPTATDSLTNGLSYLTFEDVRPAAEITFDAPPPAKPQDDKSDEEKPDDEPPPPSAGVAADGPVVAEYRAFDGLVVTVKLRSQDGKTWANFQASVDEDQAKAAAETKTEPAADAAKPGVKPEAKPLEEVKKEAQELNAKLGPWAFALPEYRAKQIASTMDDLLKPAAAAAPTGPAGPPVPDEDGLPAGPAPMPGDDAAATEPEQPTSDQPDPDHANPDEPQQDQPETSEPGTAEPAEAEQPEFTEPAQPEPAQPE